MIARCDSCGRPCEADDGWTVRGRGACCRGLPKLRISKPERAEHGEYEAFVYAGGKRLAVTREYGSWQVRGPGRTLREVLPAVAAQLQSRLPASERKVSPRARSTS